MAELMYGHQPGLKTMIIPDDDIPMSYYWWVEVNNKDEGSLRTMIEHAVYVAGSKYPEYRRIKDGKSNVIHHRVGVPEDRKSVK